MTVTVFEKDNCQACILTKRKLAAQDVPFEVASILEPENLELVRRLGYLQAPVVVTDDEHWSGFRPDKISALADRQHERSD